MASAQVLPNSNTAASARKQGHLEAGKRRLEEFRKKKAEGRARKPVATGQLPTAAVDLAENVLHEAVSNGPKSDGDSVGIVEPSRLAVASEGSATGSPQNDEVGLLNGLHSSDNQVQSVVKDEGSNLYRSSGFSGLVNGYDDHWQGKSSELRNKVTDLVSAKLNKALEPVQMSPVVDGDVKQAKVYLTDKDKLDNYRSLETSSNNSESYVALSSGTSPENSGNGFQQYTMGNGRTPLNHNNFGVNDGSMDINNYAGFNLKGRRISDSINRHLNIENMDLRTSENSFMDYSSTSKRSYGSSSARSRPSFLDSIDISRVASTSNLPSAELVKEDPPVLPNTNSMSGDVHFVSSPLLPSAKPDALESAGIRHNNITEEKVEPSPGKDDNFASLEQHIEDLTQEKFSLQRALDMSRSLSESLASENSSLTDSFNQQGKVINQLKSDMEQLQEEIRTQLLAFEALKAEYANAQLECTAADERAKILASEVISLEEKALRLRSNELKLEKQLKSSNAEITSCKRKLSGLEKEHCDFQSTIEALQEEKKLLQSKLWKASVHEIANERSGMHVKVDASTSTMDLGVDREMDPMGTGFLRNSSDGLGFSSSTILSEVVSDIALRHDNRNFHSDASGTIPDDHIKMINNISSLISELALEKEELVQALTTESSMTSKLKDLNKELSQKLEAQTQRFELLAAQQMANENLQTRPLDTQGIRDAADYTDEGDEVVERVLGWIMKLFPGGPAKRRTSKLL